MPELSAETAIEVIERFGERLDAERQRLNELNVFPVADNDTGTNMADSVADIVGRLDGAIGASELVDAVQRGALHGRGNSGLIVGQFLAGFVSAFELDGRLDVSTGLVAGAARARRAVAQPVEGTILTVADVAAIQSVDRPFDELVQVAAEAVEATTEQLDVLGRHEVVDSGAAGLLLFFESMVDVMAPSDHAAPTLIQCDVGRVEAAAPTSGRRVVGHEIRFRVARSAIEPDALRRFLTAVGTDVVVAAGGDTLAAHLHVTDLDSAIRTISAELEHQRGVQAISYDVEALMDAVGGVS